MTSRSWTIVVIVATAYGVLCSAAVIPPTVEAAARAKVFRAQLDTDPALERVIRQRRSCRQVSPYRCSRLVLRDGRRRVRLTSYRQTDYPYGWQARRLRFRDLTGDGVAEIVWELWTSGGTGSSPWRKGVHRWTGRRARLIFSFRNARRVPRGYSYSAFASARILRARDGGLPVIRTKEALNRASDGTCCPSAYRIMRHRWNGRMIAKIKGSTRIVGA